MTTEPDTEPDTERLILLAQIALEGARMTPEAQELASVDRLRTILGAAQFRAEFNKPQRAYIVDSTGAVRAAVRLDTYTTSGYNTGCVGKMCSHTADPLIPR